MVEQPSGIAKFTSHPRHRAPLDYHVHGVRFALFIKPKARFLLQSPDGIMVFTPGSQSPHFQNPITRELGIESGTSERVSCALNPPCSRVPGWGRLRGETQKPVQRTGFSCSAAGT